MLSAFTNAFDGYFIRCAAFPAGEDAFAETHFPLSVTCDGVLTCVLLCGFLVTFLAEAVTFA